MGGIVNTLKWAVAIILVTLGVVGNYHYAQTSLPIRVLALLLLLGTAIFIAFQTEKGRRFWQFGKEARAELRKVVWPTRNETLQTTAMVLGVVAVVGMILWGVDILLLKTIAWLIGYGAS